MLKFSNGIQVLRLNFKGMPLYLIYSYGIQSYFPFTWLENENLVNEKYVALRQMTCTLWFHRC